MEATLVHAVRRSLGWLVLAALVFDIFTHRSQIAPAMRETALPGRTAILYPTQAAAEAACTPQAIVFANGPARRWYVPGTPKYGDYTGSKFGDRGYGCIDDLRRDGFAVDG